MRPELYQGIKVGSKAVVQPNAGLSTRTEMVRKRAIPLHTYMTAR
jgi:hypothetical protein